MFVHSAIAILSLGAARLYRSLCQHGSLTEYMYVQLVPMMTPELFLKGHFVSSSRTSELPHFLQGRPISNTQHRAGNVHCSIHFVVATESSSTASTSDAPGFIPKDPVQLRFAPSASNPRHDDMEDKVGYGLETA
ncbi:hypothetical protein BJV78DRAFT_1239300 [Lactifluus subvellereus]|nr:hypothetical protein BJV78DRAFT_1239300 [Lactifluus subvellereus]